LHAINPTPTRTDPRSNIQ